MSLHRQPNMDDVRSAYDSDRSEPTYSERHSGSEKSYQTAPTEYSSSPPTQPAKRHHRAKDSRNDPFPPRFFYDKLPEQTPRTSVETYASTIASEEDLLEENQDYALPPFLGHPIMSNVIASTPADFSQLFPSHRILHIHHDEMTEDGNMNLRVDTSITPQGRQCDMTLFHLRMHELKNREFSLRRYCRDSGREVCHSISKEETPSRPKGHARSWSNAISSSMKPIFDSSRPATFGNMKRNDSGYGSMNSVGFDEDDFFSNASESQSQKPRSAHTVKMEFSNYAQVDIKRTGTAGNSRNEFQYWGTSYVWRKTTFTNGESKDVSFHLIKTGSEQVLACIKPVSLNPITREIMEKKGSWIMPHSMWISDNHIVRGNDVADVVVATGLISLVDDSIRTRFQNKRGSQLILPVPKMPTGAELNTSPKKFFHGMHERFKRSSISSVRHSRGSSMGFSFGSRPSTGNRPPTSRPATAGVDASGRWVPVADPNTMF